VILQGEKTKASAMVASKTESLSSGSHISWASIELLHNVVRTLTLLHEEHGVPFPVVRYRAKVKLHGSNCAVQVARRASRSTQSRTTMLTPAVRLQGL
jgi:hypothetical protein